MKKTILSFLIGLSTVIVGFAGIDALIKFDKTTHAFGNIKQNKPVTVSFVFANPGAAPLIIEDATAECGCTKPEYPQQPIMPGKKAAIKVTYDAKEPGSFTKKITIKLVNQPETKVLTITGVVIK
jgi:hypothetical protein